MEHESRTPKLREALSRAGSGLMALARAWGPRAATGAKRVAVRARESKVAGRVAVHTRKAASRAGAALKVKGRAVKEQVSGWSWPRRTLAAISTRYPILDRAWREFLHSFSLSDRPKAEDPAPRAAAARPPAARRSRTARAGRTRSSSTRKAA
jgi:hypothetical protein